MSTIHPSRSSRFVDHDMFMRYLGGAISHSIRTKDTFSADDLTDEQFQIEEEEEEEEIKPRSSDPVNFEDGISDTDMDIETSSDSSIETDNYNSDTSSHEIFCDEDAKNVHVTNDCIYL
ncbi:hypothetical protein Clacol_004960 [Clathrus columnatus]|uniref:Uncharacterized protein n=1 Tax=Clathrus columnatus TaxID=1419009 RepID=A0AAV5AC60_9AGAM|nr:hypothetical protein Clacol_004960 [Clathrus columnatus]